MPIGKGIEAREVMHRLLPNTSELLPKNFEVMEHRGAFATRTSMLNVDATKWVGIDFSTQVHLMRKSGISRLRRLRGDISSQQSFVEMEQNSAIGAITGGRNRFSEGRNLAIIVTNQIEVNCFGMFSGTDDTQTITCQRLGVELQADIHILPCS